MPPAHADTATTSARKPIVIAGGSGFLGMGLASYFTQQGIPVILLSRSAPGRPMPGVDHQTWDGRRVGEWGACLRGALALINLAGRSVDCIKTPDHQDQILRSRVESTLALGRAMQEIEAPPSVWIQMSTAHIYGDPPTHECDETSPTGVGLAPTVGRAWEEAFAAAKLSSQRGVVLRTSFVIGTRNAGGAGALGRLGLLARLGLGGRVGTGRQGFSWLHELDFARIVERAIHDERMHGVYVTSSPAPVSQAAFMQTLRRHAGGLGGLGLGLPAPGLLVRIGAPLVLRTDPELALYGRYVRPARLLAEGFTFSYPELDGALRALYGTQTRSHSAVG